MQKNLFSLAIALLPFLCMSQTNDSISYVREYKTIGKINIFDFSNGVEIKLGKTFTTYHQFGFPWGASFSYFEDKTDVDVYFIPMLKGDIVRYYHNLKGRERRGKRVEGFFANYFSLQYAIPIKQPNVIVPGGFIFAPYYMGLHYGLQRKIGKKWYWDINLGAGYSFYVDQFFFDTNAAIGIGYTFH